MRMVIDYEELAPERERLHSLFWHEGQGSQLVLGAGVVFILALTLFFPVCCYQDGFVGVGKGLGVSTLFAGGFVFITAAVRWWGGR